MKFWILSDLHLEFDEFKLTVPDADVCLVAGDIKTKGIITSLRWLQDNVADKMPVVFVAGNHEFYRSFILEALKEAGNFDGKGRIDFLENRSIEIGDAVICGCTLWTDYELFGREHAESGMEAARQRMNDFRLIGFRKQPYWSFRPEHALKSHINSRRFLEGCVREHAGRKVVFLTHHAPSMRSVEDRYRDDLLTTSFASDLEYLMLPGRPKLWVHGHVHHRVDYVVNDTRVVANPRGYHWEECYRNYDFGFVVEI